MCEETQPDGTHIKIGVNVHPWIVTHLRLLLGGKHSRSRTQYRCFVSREIPHIDAYLCVQGFEPCPVVIQPVL